MRPRSPLQLGSAYGPKPGGAFSSDGVLSTFAKHQKVPPHTTMSDTIIVTHPPVVMAVSSVCG